MDEQTQRAAIETLWTEREIDRVLWSYGRSCDERDWAAFDNIFTEDATTDYGGHTKENNRAEIVAFLRSCLLVCGPTQHFFGGHFVDVAGEEAASRACLRAFHQGKGSRAHMCLIVYGAYDLKWRRLPEGWRMTKLVFRAHAETGSREILDGAW